MNSSISGNELRGHLDTMVLSVLVLSEPIIEPLTNLQEFKSTVNFEGGTSG